MKRIDDSIRRRLCHRARVSRLMGHPTARFVVDWLTDGQLRVFESNELITADCSAISKHFFVFGNEGLMTDDKRRSSRCHRLRISPDGSFFVCMEKEAARSRAFLEKSMTRQCLNLFSLWRKGQKAN